MLSFSPKSSLGQAVPVIVAQLSGDDRATAAGIEARSSSPILLLCRKLIAAGHNARSRLDCYRGDILCLSCRSIAAAATLECNGEGAGFRSVLRPGRRPLVRPARKSALGHRSAPPIVPEAVIAGLLNSPPEYAL